MKAIDEGREELDHEELLSLEYLDAVVVSFYRLFLAQFVRILIQFLIPFSENLFDSSQRLPQLLE